MRTILVTGATSGIGRATAEELARRGARVIVHGRDPARLAETADRVASVGDGTASTVQADFSSLTSVRDMAAEVMATHDRLDVIVNNAGVFMDDRVITEDGYETTFQVNVLAGLLLTRLLLPMLELSAPARIVTVSSATHAGVRRLDLSNLQTERDWSGYNAYAKSKLGNVLLAYGFAARLEPGMVTSNCLHPGSVSTRLLHEGFGPGGVSTEHGARTPVYLATSPDVERVTGEYFVGEHIRPSSPISRDRDLQERYWETCENLLTAAAPSVRR